MMAITEEGGTSPVPPQMREDEEEGEDNEADVAKSLPTQSFCMYMLSYYSKY